ncbi:sugar-binding transcriptional regulator [Thermoflavimicrobium dichotomicum]|uniref:Central glycolytic genes regulator n=1 Tax=Thermoflavimicrobium dichotomicum TaxID=46223 RepID=A0A1I3JQR9_9BACL|nr:sugar-binding domain-containing protein [Thermoflavimicrobium dichotomicum]SFI62470.1 central glycolytic genes regulator [Thermoflavimicrobium dichotomicum]
MKDLLNIQKKLLPDLLKVMRKRYEILHQIRLMQPVGRRSLTTTIHLTERVLRSEAEFLRAQGLIDVSTAGMTLTDEGSRVLQEMEQIIRELFGITELERKLSDLLGIKEVIVVTGDTDQSGWVKKEMGRAGARVLQQMAVDNQVVAVTGGSSVLAVAEMLTPTPSLKSTTFVPTRGGLDEAVELGANYIASLMAKNSGGKYRLLHVPDQLSPEAYETLMREPHIEKTLAYLRQARIVLHGIGDAKKMAIRRKSSPEVMKKLEQEEAVGEFFGYYVNKSGSIVHQIPIVGLQLEDLDQIEIRIAVAGGASKAEAIKAVCALSPVHVLITDEGAAEEILKSSNFIHVNGKDTENKYGDSR